MSRLLTAVALVVALTTACGGGDKSSPAPEPEEPAAEPAKPEPAPDPTPPPAADVTVTPDEDGVVHMTGNDEMKFNANRIEVEGTTFKIELKHIGKMPKAAMGHNLVLLKPGNDPMAFAQTAAGAVANDYIPEDTSKIIAHTKLLGGGESDTIEVTLPGPGEYPFLCSFPGHAGLMKGVLVAK